MKLLVYNVKNSFHRRRAHDAERQRSPSALYLRHEWRSLTAIPIIFTESWKVFGKRKPSASPEVAARTMLEDRLKALEKERKAVTDLLSKLPK